MQCDFFTFAMRGGASIAEENRALCLGLDAETCRLVGGLLVAILKSSQKTLLHSSLVQCVLDQGILHMLLM